jgi:hypothetical protein
LAFYLILDLPSTADPFKFPAMIASMAGEHRNKYAKWFDPYTAELCTGEIQIRFISVSGHYETRTSGGRHPTSSKHWVQTHRDETFWGPQGCGPQYASTWDTSHARERSAVPLKVKSAGSPFEVAWRNVEGDPYVTQSRSILELRTFLSLSCADSETSNKLAADWESFKLANKKDKEQTYWASVDVKTTLGPASQFDGSRTFALSGVPCFLGGGYYSAFRIFGLGWLYRLWYSTRNGVVEMHLHRELSIRGFGDEANRTRDTVPIKIGPTGAPLAPDSTNSSDRSFLPLGMGAGTDESSAGRQLGMPEQGGMPGQVGTPR